MLLSTVAALISLISSTTAFEIVATSGTVRTRIGGTVRLSCRSDAYFEFCTWRHDSMACEFEWKASHDRVLRMACPTLKNRVRFTGHYENHECEIELDHIEAGDEGSWQCVMEGYAWGPARRTAYKKSLLLSIDAPTTTTTVQTTTGLAEWFTPTPTTTLTHTTTTTEFHDMGFDIWSDMGDSTSADDDSTATESIPETSPAPALSDPADLPEPRNLHPDDEIHSIVDQLEQEIETSSSVPIIPIVVGIVTTVVFVLLVIGVFFVYQRKRRQDLRLNYKENAKVVDPDMEGFYDQGGDDVFVNSETDSVAYKGSRAFSFNDGRVNRQNSGGP